MVTVSIGIYMNTVDALDYKICMGKSLYFSIIFFHEENFLLFYTNLMSFIMILNLLSIESML